MPKVAYNHNYANAMGDTQASLCSDTNHDYANIMGDAPNDRLFFGYSIPWLATRLAYYYFFS